MPTVSVLRESLYEALGRKFTDDEFDELCFDFGIELDEVTSEKKIIAKERGNAADLEQASDDVIYKIDIPANRYDLLCVEGLASALNVFKERQQAPRYTAVKAEQPQRLYVEESVADIRPVLVGAVLRNVTFTPESYQSFIDLQDKLHQNICRRRTLVSVGTHDLDTVQGPFYYKALPPREISFVPLNQTEKMDGVRLMEFYEKDQHLKQYLPIIRDKPRYLAIYDSNGIVCSLPPIINGNHSKITLDTRNVLIEATATDHTKAVIVVDQLVAMLSQHSAVPFTYEPVEIVYPDNRTEIHPTMKYRTEKVDLDRLTSRIGIELECKEAAKLLSRMCLDSKAQGNALEVEIPPTRADVLHACDIAEDLAIAYSYNKIKHSIPATNTVGSVCPVNKLTDLLRLELAMAGYSETLTLSLCSLKEAFSAMRTTQTGTEAVTLLNPATAEFEMCRISLIPGLFKTIASNKNMPLPLKVFEISDVILKDSSRDVGARNERRLCALYYGQSSGLEHIHGLLDRIMLMLDVPQVGEKEEGGYFIREGSAPMFFPGRQADIHYNGKPIGHFGIVHPDVLTNFDLVRPCSVLEITIEPFV